MSDNSSMDNDQLGSLGSYDLGESANDLNGLPERIPSPVGEENLGDISVGEMEDSMESVDSATARRQALRRQIRDAQENLEQLRLRADEEDFFDEGDAAQLAAFRQSLISAKRARESDGTSPVQPLALVDVPRHANPPVPIVQTALFNMQKAVVLHRLIDAPLAERFRDQARRPAFRTAWEEVILPEALEMIKIRLVNMHEEIGMTLAEAEAWSPANQTLLATAELICDLFGRPTRTETTVEINDFIYDFNFGFVLGDRTYEEQSAANFKKLLTDHYGAISEITDDEQDRICRLLYKKFPKHSQIDSHLAEKTKEYLKSKNRKKDNILACIQRMSLAIQEMRRLVHTAAQWVGTKKGQYEFFSGSTRTGQSTESSTCRYISDSTARGCPHAIGVYRARREVTTADRATPGPSKQQATYQDLYKRSQPQTYASAVCATCGRAGHHRNACKYFMNTMCNNTQFDWADSPIGEAWQREGYDKFTIGVQLRNYPVATNAQQKMPANFVYPTEEDNIGQDLPGKFQKTAHIPPPKGNGGYVYNKLTHDKSKDKKKKPKCKSMTTHVMASMFTNTDDYVSVRLTLSQTTTTVDSSTRSPQEAAQIAEVNLVLSNTTQPKDPNTDRARANKVKTVEATALLDSGSLAGDFINGRVLRGLGGAHFLRSSDQPILVCSGLDNTCVSSNVILDIDVTFVVGKEKHTIQLHVRINENSPLELVIGRDSIRNYNLASIFPSTFFARQLGENTGNTSIVVPETSTLVPRTKKCKRKQGPCTHAPCTVHCKKRSVIEPIEHNPAAELITLPDTTTPVPLLMNQATSAQPPTSVRLESNNDTPLIERGVLITPPTTGTMLTQTTRPLTALLQQTEQLLEVNDFGDESIDYNAKDMFAPFRSDPPGETTDILDKITISGSPDQQRRIRALCEKYRHIFKDELDAHPAKLTPFELDVDKKKWESYKNRGHVRTQTPLKEKEIARQVEEMLKAGIIEKSHATFYSQVMLTPKPNGDYRFCVDFRNMNDATESASWPIPNIAGLLARLGRQKADTFGVMDLTSGYHQAPLSLAARVFTAFITFAGVYHFTRLPFGPKRAPSYFQEQMATVVLGGLIHHICEMYLDDCIVYGTGTDQFLTRLEEIFKRFDAKHLFLKAAKCKLGLSEVEYVGKTISKEGITMSDKQIKGVMEFPKPLNNTQLRSFLGFVNYFRDHVPNHSNVVAPLHKMIDHSAKKQTRLLWTPEGAIAFENVKVLISRSPMLYFIHDTAPIVLMTDASDYGVGGYLYQEIDGKQQLVALVSKALTPTQLRWSVIQKEAYGIFYCCTQLDPMLRDRKFTIQTDHKNLMFIKTDSNPMVVRWWMALQELDFSIEYIKGDTNSVADALSRLCLNRKEENKYIMAALHVDKVISTEHYKAISSCHNSMIGHGGLERTIRKLKTLKFNWEAMRGDVREFIRKCPCCQKMSQVKPPVNAYKYTTSTYRPMECLNMDFIGPYPDKGYVLVIICTFTRWVELYPVLEATADTACKALLEHFGRYGAPSVLRSDNGSHFVNNVIQQFLSAVGVPHNLTLTYSSEENAIVERCNKEVNRHVRAFTFDKSTTDDYQAILPFVQRILNSSINERMKVSPAQLLFGNALDLDRGIFLPPDEQNLPQGNLTYSTSKMLKIQSDLTRITKDLLIRSDAEHNASIADVLTEFAVGTFVLALPRSAPATRLHTPWTGPYQVISSQKGQYKLLDLITNKSKMYHVTQLKPFFYDKEKVDPVDIARRDHLEYFIERILAFEGDIKRVSTLRFHVKWLGYDDSHNSWERWKNLMNTEHLHTYLISVNLRHLIPRKFLLNYV